jgi:AraC-like DNA-binding protein
MQLRKVTIDSFDPAAMDETVSGASFSHVLLAPGRFRADLLTATADQQYLDYGSYNLPIHVRGSMPKNHITLGCILTSPETTSLNGFQLNGPSLVVLHEEASLDYRLAPGTQWLAFQVTREALESLGIDPSSLPQEPIDQRSASAGRLVKDARATVNALRQLDAATPTIASAARLATASFSNLMDAFHAALFSAEGFRFRRHSALDHRLFKEATDLIDANIAETLQIGTLCSELGTNWRSLERAFTRLAGVTPKRYVQLARLAKARRLLMQPHKSNRSVSRIADSCGIVHLGRFSQAYRNYFGELPSETLRRSQLGTRSGRQTGT